MLDMTVIKNSLTQDHGQWSMVLKMKIGELAEKTGLSRDTIRFYERNSLISSEPSQSGTNSYRNYPNDLVERLNFISQARDAGMSVADLRDIFQALQGGCDPENGKRVVQRKIEELEENIARTHQVVRFLKDTISDNRC